MANRYPYLDRLLAPKTETEFAFTAERDQVLQGVRARGELEPVLVMAISVGHTVLTLKPFPAELLAGMPAHLFCPWRVGARLLVKLRNESEKLLLARVRPLVSGDHDDAPEAPAS